MRSCICSYFAKDGSFVKNVTGQFHRWGDELFKDKENPNGYYMSSTVGIVELDNGKIVTVYPEEVRFIDVEDAETEISRL